MRSKRLRAVFTLLLCAFFAAPALAIPICGDGYCDRNNPHYPETIYNCPEDCCGGFAPAGEEVLLPVLIPALAGQAPATPAPAQDEVPSS